MQVLQETDIIAEGRIKPRSAPAPAKKEGDAASSAEAPADTVAPAEDEAAAPTEAKPETAAPTGVHMPLPPPPTLTTYFGHVWICGSGRIPIFVRG